MTTKLVAKVFKFAVNGDVRAGRFYWETVDATNNPQGNTVVNSQSNYIQINNVTLSQENLKCLSAKQLNQIETVVAIRLSEEKQEDSH